ncbi:hypothetical protein CCHL11_04595 [Colletotrichum chlorophyti]|uniref:Uncharacterized protein n=1 Tax=Colletotrichum chlorophyti TaxID=708187 RepID=A0A1Q8RR83_9PEZI|nr:hypothetical protein CCHL11_04595 [Colletotrichum chlorophyti]
MLSERTSALRLFSAVLLMTGSAAARPDVYARSQQMRRQSAEDCLEDLEDVLDNAPTRSLSWPATACDFTSTLSGAELTSNYASFRSRMASWYSDDLDDITKLEASCTQYASVFSQIRYCYVTGPVPTAATSTTSSSAIATTSASSRTTATSATSTSTASSTAAPNPDDGGGMDSGAKAGLAIGIILAVLLLMFLAYKVFKKHRAKKLAEAAAAGSTGNGNMEAQMKAAAAGGAIGAGAGAGLMAAGAAGGKLRDPETSVYAFKSELSGEPRHIAELDPGAAVAVPRTTGPGRHIHELDPEPPRELSELPADNYDPTLDSPPPSYVSPVTSSNPAEYRSTLGDTVSPLSPESSTMPAHGLGISTISEMSFNGDNSGAPTTTPPNPNDTVQQGWGRGWLRREE